MTPALKCPNDNSKDIVVIDYGIMNDGTQWEENECQYCGSLFFTDFGGKK